mmetsp:Transcript_5722/g.6551  ORF Transcript_5722/g.6551 Transcript_5722/m.6551 type:complete len:146 (+) Transcript_5722:271-708(+)
MSERASLSLAATASQNSMKWVMRKEKSKWLSLFAADACIEDPVGISPLDETGEGHKGKEAIEKFWDNNIAPNEFVFNIIESISPQGSWEVCNIGQIITRIPMVRATSVTNGVFIYKVNKEGRISSLRAFYDFKTMMYSSVPFPKL